MHRMHELHTSHGPAVLPVRRQRSFARPPHLCSGLAGCSPAPGFSRAALHCGHNIARLLRGLRALWCVEDHCCPARVLDLQKKTHILLYQPCCGVCLPHASSGPLARFLRPRVGRLHSPYRERSLAEKSVTWNGILPRSAIVLRLTLKPRSVLA